MIIKKRYFLGLAIGLCIIYGLYWFNSSSDKNIQIPKNAENVTLFDLGYLKKKALKTYITNPSLWKFSFNFKENKGERIKIKDFNSNKIAAAYIIDEDYYIQIPLKNTTEFTEKLSLLNYSLTENQWTTPKQKMSIWIHKNYAIFKTPKSNILTDFKPLKTPKEWNSSFFVYNSKEPLFGFLDLERNRLAISWNTESTKNKINSFDKENQAYLNLQEAPEIIQNTIQKRFNANFLDDVFFSFNGKKTISDTIVITSYDDDFNPVQKTEILKKNKYNYQLSFSSKNPDSLQTLMLSQNWIDTKGVFIKFPFEKLELSKQENRLLFSNSSKIKSVKNLDCLFYIHLNQNAIDSSYLISPISKIKNVTGIGFSNPKNKGYISILLDKDYTLNDLF